MTARRRAADLAWRLSALLMALAPGLVAAQRPPERVAIFRLRDSLRSSADTTQLIALESRTIDSARKHRDDPLIHLRLGFLGLRLAELTGGAGHFRDAEGEFEWVTRLQPKWPVGWYGLGNAELTEADVYPPAMRRVFAVLGHDVFQAPAHDLAQSALVGFVAP